LLDEAQKEYRLEGFVRDRVRIQRTGKEGDLVGMGSRKRKKKWKKKKGKIYERLILRGKHSKRGQKRHLMLRIGGLNFEKHKSKETQPC